MIDLNKFKSLDIDPKIYSYVINLGVPASLKGFGYICFSLKILTDRTDEVACGSPGNLYRTIARAFDSNWTSVERSIRHAVDLCFLRGDEKLINRMFGSSYSSEKGRPTNIEFLSTIALNYSLKY